MMIDARKIVCRLGLMSIIGLAFIGPASGTS